MTPTDEGFEARASQTGPAGRRRRAPVSVGVPWLVAAAVVLVLVAGGIALFTTGDEESATEGAREPADHPEVTPPPTDEPPLDTPEAELDPPPPCTRHPAPSAAVLDAAVHLMFDRAPLDLDGDGVDDEMLTYEVDGGSWRFVARLADGWTGTTEVIVETPPPRLLTDADGAAAARDLDGDGDLEFFVAADTFFSIVSLPLCAGDEPVVETVVVEGEWCLPTGCEWRISCPGDHLLREMTVPGGEFDDHDPADIAWTSTEFRLVDSELLATELPRIDFPPDAAPPAAPATHDTGIADCHP